MTPQEAQKHTHGTEYGFPVTVLKVVVITKELLWLCQEAVKSQACTQCVLLVSPRLEDTCTEHL